MSAILEFGRLLDASLASLAAILHVVIFVKINKITVQAIKSQTVNQELIQREQS